MTSEEKQDGPKTLWELVEQEYRNYFPGIIVQGSMILDIDDGTGRGLRFLSSPDATSWGIKGMLHEIKSQLDAETVAEAIIDNAIDFEDDDEDVDGED